MLDMTHIPGFLLMWSLQDNDWPLLEGIFEKQPRPSELMSVWSTVVCIQEDKENQGVILVLLSSIPELGSVTPISERMGACQTCLDPLDREHPFPPTTHPQPGGEAFPKHQLPEYTLGVDPTSHA